MIRLGLIIALLVLSGVAVAQVKAPLFMWNGTGNVTPPSGCANQFVLDYSNSCALIGQGWGE